MAGQTDKHTDRVCDIMKAPVLHIAALKTNYKALDNATFLRVETMEVDDFCSVAIYCHDGGDVSSVGSGSGRSGRCGGSSQGK